MTGLQATSSHLIGRDRETDQLEDFLAGPGPRSLVLLGAPGMGKTALLGHACQRAQQQDITVLRTGTTSAERDLPYAALHRLLLPLLARTVDLPPDQHAALSAAFVHGTPASTHPAHVAAATTTLLAATTVLVVVDDLGRLDPASRDVLVRLAAPAAPHRALILMACCENPAHAWLPATLPTLPLLPLDRTAADLLLARTAVPLSIHQRRQILGTAAGNPLALRELPSALSDLGDHPVHPGPAMTERLASRLARTWITLPTAARTWVLLAALAETDDLNTLRHAARTVLGPDADTALSAVVQAGLLQSTAEEIRFVHPLTRTAVAHLAPLTCRLTAHAALADAIGDQPAGLANAARHAWHRAHAATGLDEDAGDLLEARHVHPDAQAPLSRTLAALHRAAQLTADPARRLRRLLAAADLAAQMGQPQLALRQLRSAGPLTDPADEAHAVHILEQIGGRVGEDPSRIPVLCSFAEHVHTTHPERAGQLLYAAALRSAWTMAGPAGRRPVASTLARCGDRIEAHHALAVRALTDPVTAAGQVAKAARTTQDATTCLLLGQAAHHLGDPALAASLLTAACRAPHLRGRTGLLSSALAPLAAAQLWLARDLDQPLHTAARAADTAAADCGWGALAVGLQAVLYALRGQTGQALSCAVDVEEVALRGSGRRQLALARLARALVWSDSGRYGEAYSELQGIAGDPVDVWGYEHLCAVAFLAEAAVPAGQVEDARRRIEAWERHSTGLSTPLAQRPVAYARAVLATGPQAQDHFHQALRAVSGWPLLQAMTDLAYGVWLRRQRRVTESRLPLRRAHEAFIGLGVPGRTQLAAVELRAAGDLAGADEPERALAGQLSPQELTIARLVAQGLSNREIGEQLHLSPRTVASHLYRIFPKIDVRTRKELAQRLSTDQ